MNFQAKFQQPIIHRRVAESGFTYRVDVVKTRYCDDRIFKNIFAELARMRRPISTRCHTGGMEGGRWGAKSSGLRGTHENSERQPKGKSMSNVRVTLFFTSAFVRVHGIRLVCERLSWANFKIVAAAKCANVKRQRRARSVTDEHTTNCREIGTGRLDGDNKVCRTKSPINETR